MPETGEFVSKVAFSRRKKVLRGCVDGKKEGWGAWPSDRFRVGAFIRCSDSFASIRGRHCMSADAVPPFGVQSDRQFDHFGRKWLTGVLL